MAGVIDLLLDDRGARPRGFAGAHPHMANFGRGFAAVGKAVGKTLALLVSPCAIFPYRIFQESKNLWPSLDFKGLNFVSSSLLLLTFGVVAPIISSLVEWLGLICKNLPLNCHEMIFGRMSLDENFSDVYSTNNDRANQFRELSSCLIWMSGILSAISVVHNLFRNIQHNWSEGEKLFTSTFGNNVAARISGRVLGAVVGVVVGAFRSPVVFMKSYFGTRFDSHRSVPPTWSFFANLKPKTPAALGRSFCKSLAKAWQVNTMGSWLNLFTCGAVYASHEFRLQSLKDWRIKLLHLKMDMDRARSSTIADEFMVEVVRGGHIDLEKKYVLEIGKQPETLADYLCRKNIKSGLLFTEVFREQRLLLAQLAIKGISLANLKELAGENQLDSKAKARMLPDDATRKIVAMLAPADFRKPQSADTPKTKQQAALVAEYGEHGAKLLHDIDLVQARREASQVSKPATTEGSADAKADVNPVAVVRNRQQPHHTAVAFHAVGAGGAGAGAAAGAGFLIHEPPNTRR